MAADVRTLPGTIPLHSLEAEQAVLGSLLIDPTAWARVTGKLEAKDFFRPDHRTLFTAIAKLASKGRECDVVTVSTRLQAAGQLDEAGGMAYIGKLGRETASASHVEAYAEVVRERSMRRQLASLAESIARAVNVPGKADRSAEELLGDAQRSLFELQTQARTGQGLVSVQDLTTALYEDLERRREKVLGLMTGLADFDRITSGLEPGDLVVLAGRPAMGKTAVLGTMALHASVSGATAVFSAEMPSLQLMRRAVANLGDVSQTRLRRAEQLDDADWVGITQAGQQLAERRLWIDETPQPTLAHVRAESMGLKLRMGGLALVLVDYLQLVQGDGRNRYEEIHDVVYGFKAMAKALHVPVVLLAQLNRGVESREDKRPRMSDLRDSGAIEEAADVIGLLYREGYYNRDFGMPNVLECDLQKVRNGECGMCVWHLAGDRARVTALDDGARAQYQRYCAQARRSSTKDDNL